MSEYRIDLRQVDELAAHDRQMQAEDRERVAGLRAAFFLVVICVGGTMTFGFGCVAVELFIHGGLQ